ncbi:MAG: hypothetical protein ACREO9_07275, partial [Lysobacterales bacterium]
ATAMAFLSDAWLGVCDLGKAFELRRQNVELSRLRANATPEDPERQLDVAYALSGLAAVQKQLSLSDQALEGLRESERILSRVLQKDPQNLAVAWEVNLRKQRIVWLVANTGQPEPGWEQYKNLLPTFKADFEQGMKSDFGAAVDLAEAEIDFSALAWRIGEKQAAETELNNALERLSRLISEKPDNRASRYQMARGVFAQWVQTGQLPAAEAGASLGDYLQDPERVRSCGDANLAARLAVMHGDEMLARRYTSYLLDRGFFDPEFIGFCQGYGICN